MIILKRSLKKVLAFGMALLLVAGLAVSLWSTGTPHKASAKTTASAAAERVFFYAASSSGEDVLIKIIEMNDLIAIAHGQLSNITYGTDTGTNYYYSYTDNLPTTGYGEGRGFLLTEFVGYVKSVSSVLGVQSLTYSGDDTLLLMATDSQGSYNKDWTYNELYGEERYYFPDFYGASGWNERWEISGTNAEGEAINLKGISLEEYNSAYRAGDSYSSSKDAVFAGGERMPVILSPVSYAGRTNASADTTNEVGISDYIDANNGVVTGSLAGVVNTDAAEAYSLRLFIPQTHADLMCGHRTAFDNFKWIYNVKLADAVLPNISSAGTVAAPTYSVEMSADNKTAYITMQCSTPGASIYYSVDTGDALSSAGAPQYLYTGAVAVNAEGIDLNETPLKFYMTAVREGWSDNGIISVSYPPAAPAFKTIYSSDAGEDLVYQVSVNNSVWQAWASGLSRAEIKAPSSAQFSVLGAGDYTADAAAGTLTISGNALADAGAYAIRLVSDGFANKTLGIMIKATAQSAPAIQTDSEYYIDDLKSSGLKIKFGNTGYSSGTSVSIEGTAINSGAYLVRNDGDVLIKPNYFNSANSKIKTAGTYQIALINNSFVPASRTISVTVLEGSAPSYAFELNAADGSTSVSTGDEIGVSLQLTASEAFTFYSGQYTLMYDAAKVAVTDVTAADGWEYGVTADASGMGYLTLLRVTDGAAFGTNNQIAAFTVKATGAGNAGLTPLTYILTSSTAAARGKVSAVGCTLEISGGSGVQGDVNGDGSVTIFDAVLLMQILTGAVTEDIPAGADVNGDGSVTIFDAVLLMQMLTG
jgi:hypothetical protein